MRFLKRLVFWLVGIVVLLAAISFLLPRIAIVERSVTMTVPPERVYPLIADLREWNKWSPWYESDPQMKQTFSGAESGVGARAAWESTKEGSGNMVIDVADPGKRLEFTINFVDMGSTAKGRFDIEPAGAGTRVRWRMESDAGTNPIGRWFGLLALDRLVGPYFERGLAKMEKVAAGS